MNKKLRRPSGPFPSLPNGMDRVLKEYFDYYAQNKLIPPELENENVTLFNEPILTTWQNARSGLRYKTPDGDTIMGAVDYILVRGQELIVLDFKTRAQPATEQTIARYKNQLSIYTMLLHKNNNKVTNYAYLLFYYPQSAGAKGKLTFNTQLEKIHVDIDHAEKLCLKAIASLKQPLPEPSEHCPYCAWHKAYSNATSQKSIGDF